MDNLIKVTYHYLEKQGYYLDSDGDVAIHGKKINKYNTSANREDQRCCDIWISIWENHQVKKYRCHMKINRIKWMLEHKMDIPVGYFISYVGHETDGLDLLNPFADDLGLVCYHKYRKPIDGQEHTIVCIYTPELTNEYVKFIY